MSQTQSRIEIRKLAKLKPFPGQCEFFDDLSDHDLSELAADIRRNGLKTPIEVVPANTSGLAANTILDGHQRQRALLILGETKTKVLVRHDLAKADSQTIEAEFLRPNLLRRQLDPLAKARGALRLFEIEINRAPGKLRPSDEAAARERVAKALNLSGKTLMRHWSILRAPLEIQNAYRQGRLPLVVATRIANLPPTVQTKIADGIRAGSAPKMIASKYLAQNDRKNGDIHSGFAALLTGLKKASTLIDRLEEVPPKSAKRNLVLLKNGRRVLRRLIEIAEESSE